MKGGFGSSGWAEKCTFGLDVCHAVVYRQSGCHASARGVDVQVDWLFRVICIEKEELGHDGGADGVVDVAGQTYDALFQEAGEDVVAVPLASLVD